MKKLMILAFFALLMPAYSQANGPKTTASAATVATPTDDETSYIDLENNFWFQEKVYIHISDAADKPLVGDFYSREDLKQNKVLKELLRKSTLYLQINNHYYFFMEK